MTDRTDGWTKWSWWWSDPHPGGGTNAQNIARLVLIPIALVVLLPSFLTFAHLLKACGVSDRPSALISLLTTFPFAIFVSRSISMLICPNTIREADQDTIAKENSRSLG
jgi:uncharacterized membrane protein